jgi:hypothetical protein
MEGRVVVTVDVPGAFMQADIDEFIIVKSAAVIEDTLVRLSERFGKEGPFTINRGTVHEYLGKSHPAL